MTGWEEGPVGIIHTYTFFFKAHDLIYTKLGRNDPQAKGLQEHSNGTPGPPGDPGHRPQRPSDPF